MALGFYDDNGIWMHAEGDTFPLTSEVLNRGQRSVSDALEPLVLLVPRATTAADAAEAAAAAADLAAAAADLAAADADAAALVAAAAAQSAALGVTKFAAGGDSRTPPSIGGVGFNLATIDAPTDGANYASFPGTCDTRDGALVVVWRASIYHNFVNPGQAGRLHISRSVDGIDWEPRELLFDETPTYDLRDPCLYRAPGEQRIYLTYVKFTAPSDNTPGLFICYSDDNGRTFSTPASVMPSVSAGIHPRKMMDGTWRWPAFERRTDITYRAILLTATDPLGPWTKQGNIYEDASSGTSSTNEADIVELSATSWVSVVRHDPTLQAVVVQSTDKGATWSAPTNLPLLPTGVKYDGWPTLIKLANGRVLCFIRAGGLRVIELVDQASPLLVGSWREPGVNGVFGTYLTASGGGFVGKFVPIETGDTIRGAYMAETSGNTGASILFGGMSAGALNVWVSHIQTAEKTPDGSPINYYAMPTPDTLTFWTPGGMHRVEYQARSYQASGAVSTWQLDLDIDGTLQGAAGQWFLHTSGTTQPVTNASYAPNGRWGYKWLPRGTHTITLKSRQDNFTVSRTFADRTMAVSLIS